MPSRARNAQADCETDMVNWAALVFNGLWVLGAALVLAAVSLSCYEARWPGGRWRDRLAAPGFQFPILAGCLLISLGLTLAPASGPRWWERALWALCGVASAWQLWTIWRERKNKSH